MQCFTSIWIYLQNKDEHLMECEYMKIHFCWNHFFFFKPYSSSKCQKTLYFKSVSSLSPRHISQSALHLSFLPLPRLSLYLCAFLSYHLFNLLSLSLPLTACGSALPLCFSVIPQAYMETTSAGFSHKVPLTLERHIGENEAMNDRGLIEPINDLMQVWYIHFRCVSCLRASALTEFRSRIAEMKIKIKFKPEEIR